jgi:hypothetical protein
MDASGIVLITGDFRLIVCWFLFGVLEEILIFVTVAASKRSRSPKSKELWLWLSLLVARKARIIRMQTIMKERLSA